MNKKPQNNRARDIGFFALLIIILLATILTMVGGNKPESVKYS